jgi:hypothetical protein
MLDRETVIQATIKKYGAPICLDCLDEALQCETLEEAIEVLIVDNYYWDEIA